MFFIASACPLVALGTLGGMVVVVIVVCWTFDFWDGFR